MPPLLPQIMLELLSLPQRGIAPIGNSVGRGRFVNSLWADAGFSDLGRKFRTTDVLDYSDLAILIGVLVTIGIISWALVKLFYVDETGRYHRPRMLFLQLCRAHRLDWASRWLLWRLARRRNLPSAAELFLAPDAWNVEELGPAWTTQQAHLTALRDRVFAPSDP